MDLLAFASCNGLQGKRRGVTVALRAHCLGPTVNPNLAVSLIRAPIDILFLDIDKSCMPMSDLHTPDGAHGGFTCIRQCLTTGQARHVDNREYMIPKPVLGISIAVLGLRVATNLQRYISPSRDDVSTSYLINLASLREDPPRRIFPRKKTFSELSLRGVRSE